MSTVLSVLASWFVFTPPFYSFQIAHPIDYVRLGSLLFVGALVSVVCESLHRAKGQNVVDTSQRKCAEKLLLDSEQRYSSLFENMLDGFAHCKMVFDDQGRPSDFVYLSVNPEFETMTGLKNAAGKRATELFPEIQKAHPELLEIYGRVALSRQPERFDIEFTPLKSWFSISAYSPREGQFVAVFNDITERKKAEKATRENEAELTAIYTNVPHVMLLLDSDLRICKANKSALQFESASSASLVSDPACEGLRCLNALQRPEDCGLGPHCERCSMRLAVLDTFATGRGYHDLEAVLPLRMAGKQCDVAFLVSTAKLEVEGQPKVLVTLQDITGRKEAEKQLSRQFSLMKCITDKSTDSIFLTDSEGRVTFLNPEAQRVFGFTIEEIKGQVLHNAIHHHHPDGRSFPARECAVAKTFETGETLRDYEDVYFRKDGSMIDVIGSAAVLEADAERLGIVYVLHDVTERRQEARAKLRSQKLEALGTIAGGIAHDFNNILAAINGNAHFAMSELRASGPVRDCLSQISKAGDRAASLVRRILDFSSPRERKPEVQLLQPVVDEAVKLIRSTISSTIQIHIDFAPDLPPARVDSSQIHQVIVNLVTNAAQAIGDRPGRIDVRIDAVDINPEDVCPASKLREGRYVRLYVGDDGCGIEPIILDQIFDPFFTTKPVGQGTGLGLSIVHGIVTKLSGAITVNSKPGEGTAFHAYFPAVERRVEKVVPQRQQTQCSHCERVLYVDDEEALVFLAKNRLERLGCHVTGFTDPEGALREFRTRPREFDVVVTDVSMPHLSGFDLARELLSVRPEIPIVVTTGYVRPEDQAKAEKLGIYEIVPKPCRIDDLTGAFERLSVARASTQGASSL